jgi:hypothetical protein
MGKRRIRRQTWPYVLGLLRLLYTVSKNLPFDLLQQLQGLVISPEVR